MKKHIMMKALPLTMITGMLMTTPVLAYDKSETVYTKVDEDGTITYAVVNEQLTSNKKETIDDYSNLSGIKNISGDETFTQDGKNIKWQSVGNNIFYQGTTSKALPIETSVTYKLDGSKMKPSKMKGEAGHVEITIDYRNTLAHRYKGDTIYTPFLVLLGTTLDATTNNNITINNGRVINNGETNAIIGIASPGLYDSLNGKIDRLSDFDSLTIEFDTTDCDIKALYQAASPQLLSSSDIDDVFDEINDKLKDVDRLEDGIEKIVDGAVKLSDGTKELNDGTKKLDEGVKTLDDGAKKLNDGASKLSDGTNSYNDGLQKAASGALQLKENSAALSAGSSSLSNGLDSLAQKLPDLVSGISDAADGAKALAAGLDTLNNKLSSEEAQQNLKELAQGATEIKNATSTVESGIKNAVYQATTYQIYLKTLSQLDASQFTALNNALTSYQKATEDYAQAAGKLAAASKLKGYLDDIDDAYKALEEAKKEAKKDSEAAVKQAKQSQSDAEDELEKVTSKKQAQKDLLDDLKKEKPSTEGESEEDAEAIKKSSQNAIDAASDALDAIEKSEDAAKNAIAAAKAALKAAESSDEDVDKIFDNALKALSDAKTALNNEIEELEKDGGTSEATANKLTAMKKAEAVLNAYEEGLSSIYPTLTSIKAETIASYCTNGGEPESLSPAINQAKATIKSLTSYAEGASSVSEGTLQLIDNMKTIASGINSASQGANNLSAGLNQLKAATGADSELMSGINALVSGSKNLDAGVQKYVSGANSLADGVDQLAAVFNQIVSGASSLADGTKSLSDGTKTLKNGTGALSQGTTQLKDGAGKLADGIKKFKSEGIDQIMDALDDLDGYEDRLDQMLKYAKNYRYTETNKDADYTTKFIYVIQPDD